MMGFRLLVLSMLVATTVHAQPPTVLQAGRYEDDTIKMSWVTIEYAYRVVRSKSADYDRAHPGAPLLRMLMSSNMQPPNKPRIESSLSYLEVRFKGGEEHVHYKLANDTSPNVVVQKGWTKEQIRQVARLCEDILDSRATNKRPLPDNLADAWIFVKKASVDPFLPDEDGAEIVARFVAKLAKDGEGGLDAATKAELQDFKNKLKGPFKVYGPRLNDDFDPGSLKLKAQDVNKFRDFRTLMQQGSA